MKRIIGIKIFIAALVLGGIFTSCTTLPDYETVGFCLPQNGDRVIYIQGKNSKLLLEPMAGSLGVEEYEEIEPLLEQTDRIYLVNRGEELFIQGEGDYSKGRINFFLGTNRDWKKRKIGPFGTYESESTGLQIIFPDSHFFFLSMGNLAEILASYQEGGSPFFPFERDREKQESFLMTIDLERGAFLPIQEIIKTPFTMIEVALTPSEEESFLMDVTLWGEEGKGRMLGTALKIFLLTSIGRDVMRAETKTGDNFAQIIDINVKLDFLMNMLGLEGEK
jgi:hypothetical protein